MNVSSCSKDQKRASNAMCCDSRHMASPSKASAVWWKRREGASPVLVNGSHATV